jgi:isoleucyl-tRNA synthetase
MSFKKVNPKQNFPELEEEILKFWNKEKIFEKSVEERSKKKTFSFYDGPPYATGLPHYGHLLAGTIKDVVPRYKTMQGFRVERIWGWDTHGLPIENIVEQELNFKTKLHIRKYGVDKFNDKCKKSVLKYTAEWKKIVERTGRWVDMENAYITMDIKYMESVWWVFKSLWDKNLIYSGHKVMPYCPRCATGLSNFEVGMAYEDKTDKAITVKFEIEDEPGTFLLAWTTTPWTLPGNLALALGKNISYLKIKSDKHFYILAKDKLDDYRKDFPNLKIVSEFKGSKIVGKKYKPIFNFYKKVKKAFEILAGDFVSTEDGTGIVHIAPAFGEDDYRVAKENGIDFFMPVNDLGEFELNVPDYAGQSVVESETNQQIINDLGNKIIRAEDYTHAYPHCWRCKTPLIYKAIDSWFVAVEKVKKQMIENNKKINWVPEFVGKGRFQKMVETAPDWNISRNRFWGVPLPVWICEKCNKNFVFGNVEELEKASRKKINDIHLHKIQEVELKCECGGLAKLTGEVLDVWFDSGSMPYASVHYPFENKEKFTKDFPADFIAEGIDQTRGWFNSLLILGTILFNKTPYKNVVVNGTVLAEDGQKMSKSLKNYPDPMHVIYKYGADAMRFYLMSSPAVRGEDLRFSEKGVDEIFKKLILTLWNSYSFFITYANIDNFKPAKILNKPKNILDQWILSETENLNLEITKFLDNYELDKATRYFGWFLDNLSNWYIRRSRRRFWKSDNDADKKEAYDTLYYILVKFVKLLAPFMPFISEEIYKNLTGRESIHLDNWPETKKEFINRKLMEEMARVRGTIALGLANRAKEGIKIRQPLSSVSSKYSYKGQFVQYIKEELNIKDIKKGEEGRLNLKITSELLLEGLARELVRQIQEARKEANFNVEDRIETSYQTQDKELEEAIKKFAENSEYSIKKETLSEKLVSEGPKKIEYQKDLLINKKKIWIGLIRK